MSESRNNRIYRIIAIGIIGSIANAVGLLTNVPFWMQVGINVLTIVALIWLEVLEMDKADLHSQLEKVNRDWYNQKAQFNMHLQGAYGKKVYLEILRNHLTRKQMLQLKKKNLLAEILNPQEGGLVKVEITLEDLNEPISSE